MVTLKKTKIFQELFSVAYYYGPQRTNDMWLKQTDLQLNKEGLCTDDFTYDNTIKILLADYQGVEFSFCQGACTLLTRSNVRRYTGRRVFGLYPHVFNTRSRESIVFKLHNATKYFSGISAQPTEWWPL